MSNAAVWLEWQAQAAVDRYRSLYPDLTADEEDTIYRASVSGHTLLFRCAVQACHSGFYLNNALYCEITDCFTVTA